MYCYNEGQQTLIEERRKFFEKKNTGFRKEYVTCSRANETPGEFCWEFWKRSFLMLWELQKETGSLCSVWCTDQSLELQHFAIMEAVSPGTNLTPRKAKKRGGNDQFLHVQGWAAKSNQLWSQALPRLPMAIELSFISVFFPLSMAYIWKQLITSENGTQNPDSKASISFILLYALATKTALLTHMASQLH